MTLVELLIRIAMCLDLSCRCRAFARIGSLCLLNRNIFLRRKSRAVRHSNREPRRPLSPAQGVPTTDQTFRLLPWTGARLQRTQSGLTRSAKILLQKED